MNLIYFVSLARESWKEHNPLLYEDLRLSGQLEQALRNAAELTQAEMTSLEEAGFSNQEAWEMTRENYLLLPPEEVLDTEVNQGAVLFKELIALQNKILRSDEFEGE